MSFVKALLTAFVLVLMLPLAACSDEGRLTIESRGGTHSFSVEIVDTPESRAQGLM